jgi:hypothetical protein
LAAGTVNLAAPCWASGRLNKARPVANLGPAQRGLLARFFYATLYNHYWLTTARPSDLSHISCDLRACAPCTDVAACFLRKRAARAAGSTAVGRPLPGKVGLYPLGWLRGVVALRAFGLPVFHKGLSRHVASRPLCSGMSPTRVFRAHPLPPGGPVGSRGRPSTAKARMPGLAGPIRA